MIGRDFTFIECVANGFQHARVGQTVHLGKPWKVMGDGGGAALDLHKWDLIFGCHQDVFLVVEHSRQVHAPNYINTICDRPNKREKTEIIARVTVAVCHSQTSFICVEPILTKYNKYILEPSVGYNYYK